MKKLILWGFMIWLAVLVVHGAFSGSGDGSGGVTATDYLKTGTCNDWIQTMSDSDKSDLVDEIFTDENKPTLDDSTKASFENEVDSYCNSSDPSSDLSSIAASVYVIDGYNH